MLDKSAVTRLVIACVITDLEHGRLHIIAPVEFLLRYGFEPFPQHGFLDLLPCEVPVFGRAVCSYPAFVFDFRCRKDFICSLVYDCKFVTVQHKVVSRGFALQA